MENYRSPDGSDQYEDKGPTETSSLEMARGNLRVVRSAEELRAARTRTAPDTFGILADPE